MELALLDAVPQPEKTMSMAQVRCCLQVPLMMPWAIVLSVCSGVAG
jgi:hypothetical protein